MRVDAHVPGVDDPLQRVFEYLGDMGSKII
jgi:hypothetical protein